MSHLLKYTTVFGKFKFCSYHENGTHPPHTGTSTFSKDVNHPGGIPTLYPGINQPDHAPENVRIL